MPQTAKAGSTVEEPFFASSTFSDRSQSSFTQEKFGFDEKCTSIYHVSCVFTLMVWDRLKRCAALDSTMQENLLGDLKEKKK